MKNLTLAFMLLLSFSAISCKKPGIEPSPELSTWSVTFPKEGGTASITSDSGICISECGYNGNLYFPEYNGNTIEGPWFQVDYNDDTYTVNITVNENTSGKGREFGIGIQKGDWFGGISIRQE